MTVWQEEIIEKINYLRSTAYSMDHKSHTKGNYKWEIGTDVVRELMAINQYDYTEVKPDEKLMLLGYFVSVNYEDPYVIKLWAEV